MKKIAKLLFKIHRLIYGYPCRSEVRLGIEQYHLNGGLTWYTSPFEASAMIHPIFSTALDASLGFSNEVTQQETWGVFPNPAQKEVQVTLPAVYHGKQIILFDAMGKIQAAQTDCTFDISALPNGVYFLRCPQTSLGTLKLIINN